jgi:hypothetical protein
MMYAVHKVAPQFGAFFAPYRVNAP